MRNMQKFSFTIRDKKNHILKNFFESCEKIEIEFKLFDLIEKGYYLFAELFFDFCWSSNYEKFSNFKLKIMDFSFGGNKFLTLFDSKIRRDHWKNSCKRSVFEFVKIKKK